MQSIQQHAPLKGKPSQSKVARLCLKSLFDLLLWIVSSVLHENGPSDSLSRSSESAEWDRDPVTGCLKLCLASCTRLSGGKSRGACTHMRMLGLCWGRPGFCVYGAPCNTSHCILCKQSAVPALIYTSRQEMNCAACLKEYLASQDNRRNTTCL